MSDLVTEQLRIYCGMSKVQADAFLSLYDGKIIHLNQFSAFVGAGLITRRKDPDNKLAHLVTNVGFLMLARIATIQKGTFSGVKPKFTPEELTALSENVTRMAQMTLPKTLGLRSAHLKALVTVARHPSIVLRSVISVHDADTVGLLMSKSMIGCTETHLDLSSKHLPLYVLTQGLSLLNWCLNDLKLKGE